VNKAILKAAESNEDVKLEELIKNNSKTISFIYLNEVITQFRLRLWLLILSLVEGWKCRFTFGSYPWLRTLCTRIDKVRC
jgi:hypothetical protein